MNTPNVHTVMPGDRYVGAEPWGAMTRDEFVSLLEDFAARHRLPVDRETEVTELAGGPDGSFRLATTRGNLLARSVVIASGSLVRPRRPLWAADVPRDLYQIDASDYRNPGKLADGAVLVVGNAQSGGQIAEELVQAGRVVYLATGRIGRLVRRYRGRDMSYWLLASGLFDVPRKDLLLPSGRIASRPTLGARHTISLQSLSAQGAVLLGRLTGFDNGRFRVADDLEENMRFADEASDRVKRLVDAYILSAGIDAPSAEPDPAEVVTAPLPNPSLRALDPLECGLGSVVWCTGFRGDYGWVKLPVLDRDGQPLHDEGVSRLPGIYFAGLDFASTRRSGTIYAVAEEAPRIAGHLARRREVDSSGPLA